MSKTMNTTKRNHYTTLIETHKSDWFRGFIDALEFDVCDPTIADVSEEAYSAGYGYAMDWIIEIHGGCQTCPGLPLIGSTEFRKETLS
jgi:hypothetical protein